LLGIGGHIELRGALFFYAAASHQSKDVLLFVKFIRNGSNLAAVLPPGLIVLDDL
jgi:hypothetical protein